MKRILFFMVLLSTTIAFSQKKYFETEVSKISRKIDRITQQQKDSLKLKIEAINKRVQEKELTMSDGETLKKEAAIYHANQIELLVSQQEQKLQQLVQDKTDGKIASKNDRYEENIFSIGGETFKLRLVEGDGKPKRKYRPGKRTTTQFVFAMGANNVLVNHNFNSLNDSEYEFWKSRFYEVGFSFKTRFSKEPSKTYFKYGISFLWNNLRLTGNRYHTINGDITNIENHPHKLSESRLRHVQMIFPMHIEFDFSENRKYDDKIVDQTHKGLRIGFGGFAGFKLGTRQYLEYRNDDDIKVEELQKASFNTNILNYGVSAYIAYRSWGLYAKYDLNPLFKDTKTRNLSMGIRLDLN